MKEFEADLDELRNYAGNSEKVVKALEEACLESIGEIVDAIKEEFNRKLKAVSTIGGLSSSKSPSRSSESRTGSSLRSSESSRGSSSRSSESGRSFLLGS
ncbi:MAG: hypothetical protein LBD11_05620 [Candidatus Peribacteria bacterium]|jgi:hypothetical protein|nr:hypothetical protein [Candidatus Peribacteria bacterium]